MIGKTLSHYKIVSELGRGGMGIVYKAEDTNLDRIVAIKILPPQIVTTDEDQARFKREARAAAALNHPNIATVHDLGETEDGQTFIVMEHVGGLSLSEKLNQGPLEIETAVTLASQIAEGLSIAHQSGIVHRDVKPSNMMLTEDGRIKILDFGLAKLTGGIDITKTGSTIGTAAYMSPEQARGEEVDHRTDIWSVGVVLYEMLTGKRPFVAEYDAALAYSILNTEHESVSSIRTGVKPELEQIINRAMAKGFDQRYQTMEALFEDLRTLSGSGQPAALAPSLGDLLKRPGIVIPTLILVIFAVAFFMWRDRAGERATWARQEALPEIERLVESQSWDAAFQLALEAEKYIPNDSALIRLWPRFSDIVNIKTEPSGATFYRQPYGGSGWDEVGVTPIVELRSPFGRVNFRVEKEGYRALEWTPINWDRELTLDKEEDIPAGMVRVSGVVEEDAIDPKNSSLRLPPGLDDVKKESLQEFLTDITEVTNQDFKQFVDAGAYQSESFWSHNFVLDGHVISWEETMRLFTDRTGQPGPANWEVGDFPDGQENYPVNGLSWYEAAAYAEFVGKSLPTVFHWARAARISWSGTIVPESNLSGSGPAVVAQFRGLGPFGTLDMAGNVREWVWNESGKNDERYILGGGWDDPDYGFTDAFTRHPMDRSLTNGFRCVSYIVPNENQSVLERPLVRAFRDFYAEEPVSDETFALILRQYAYDREPLNAVVESVLEDDDFTREIVTFDAAYGDERMMGYLFTPNEGTPPFQAVVYFPGSGVLHFPSSENAGLSPGHTSRVLAKNGRAFFYPVLKNTFERGNELTSDYFDTSIRYKDHMIMWSKDIRRAVDFLESRDDIDGDKVAFYGVSWGGMLGPVMTAVETRFKASVIRVGGLAMESVLPEADPFNFLPRVTVPTLMLNGQYDYFFPYESSQLPYYERLGLPEDDKKIVVTEAGHSTPREIWIKEMLGWLDRYLGPVK